MSKKENRKLIKDIASLCDKVTYAMSSAIEVEYIQQIIYTVIESMWVSPDQPPQASGNYIVKTIIGGEPCITDATYNGVYWEVEIYQIYDPHWETLKVDIKGWMPLPEVKP